MLLRTERPEDVPAIRRVVERAFGRPDEAAIVDALRAAGAAVLSLVAEDGGRVVAHVLFSPVEVDGVRGALALAPMAVDPDHQRTSVGTALVTRALELLRERGVPAVFVLGHPAYYPRFGFVPASRFGIACPLPARDEAFLATELRPGSLIAAGGTLRYHPALA